MLTIILMILALASASAATSGLAGSLSLGPVTQAALDSVSSSSGLAGFSISSALQSYVNQLEAHGQNIRASLNILRANATNQQLAWLFTPLSQMEQHLGQVTTATKSLSNAGSALGSLHLMTTDRSQGLSNLTGGAASIAAAFLNAPANVAARVLSAGINSLNNIADTSSSVATQFSGRPAIVAGLGAFNRQLERDASALSALANVTQGWIGYDSQVIGAAQNLAKGDLSGWASALGLGATPSNAASTSFQLFNTHLSG